jgi:hypothetical protein
MFTFLDLIPKSAYAALIAVLMVTTVKLHWDKTGLVLDVQVGKTKVAQLETSIATANAKSAEVSESLTRKVLDAQFAAQRRETALLADISSANAALASLRLSTAATRTSYRLSGPTTTTQYQYADTGYELLDLCTTDLVRVSTAADGHVSDLKMMIDAWPTK